MDQRAQRAIFTHHAVYVEAELFALLPVLHRRSTRLRRLARMQGRNQLAHEKGDVITKLSLAMLGRRVLSLEELDPAP